MHTLYIPCTYIIISECPLPMFPPTQGSCQSFKFLPIWEGMLFHLVTTFILICPFWGKAVVSVTSRLFSSCKGAGCCSLALCLGLSLQWPLSLSMGLRVACFSGHSEPVVAVVPGLCEHSSVLPTAMAHRLAAPPWCAESLVIRITPALAEGFLPLGHLRSPHNIL